MLNWLQRALVFLARFVALWRVMGFTSAVRSFGLARRSSRLIRVAVKQLGRDLHFRGRADFGMLTHLYDPNYRIIDTASRPVGTIIDAGANIGLESLRFRHNHPDARIVAIEPDIENFALLRRNCGDDPRIELFNLALWSGPATLALRQESNNEAFQVTTEAGAGPKVEALSIENILTRFDWPRIGILKLDIEGANMKFSAPEPNAGSTGSTVSSWRSRTMIGRAQPNPCSKRSRVKRLTPRFWERISC